MWEFGVDTKHTMKEVGTMLFHVLYVPELKMNLLSNSTLEDKGVGILFQDEHVLTYLEGATLDTVLGIGVREGKMYRLQGKLVGGSKGILDHGPMLVAEYAEKEAQKGEQRSQDSTTGCQPSGGEEELAPSSSVRKPSV